MFDPCCDSFLLSEEEVRSFTKCESSKPISSRAYRVSAMSRSAVQELAKPLTCANKTPVLTEPQKFQTATVADKLRKAQPSASASNSALPKPPNRPSRFHNRTTPQNQGSAESATKCETPDRKKKQSPSGQEPNETTATTRKVASWYWKIYSTHPISATPRCIVKDEPISDRRREIDPGRERAGDSAGSRLCSCDRKFVLVEA